MKFIEYAETVLRHSDYRLTKPRQLVLEVLNSANSPLNAYDISNDIKERGDLVDVSTVYRILEVYKRLGLVHFVRELQGYVRCQDFSCNLQTHCHHQFVCRSCSKVTEVHVTDAAFLNTLKKQFKQFLLESHYLELAGLCNSCR